MKRFWVCFFGILFGAVVFYYGIVGIQNILSLENSDVQTSGYVSQPGIVTFTAQDGHPYSFGIGYYETIGQVSIFYNLANPTDAIVKGGGAWTFPLSLAVFGGLFLLFMLYLIGELIFTKKRPDGTYAPAKIPQWFSDTRMDRRTFVILSVAAIVLVLVIGIASEAIFGDSLASTIIIGIVVIICFVGGFFATTFRSNDVSSDTQLQLWQSGNMWFVQGWMLWFAPSAPKGTSSFHEVNGFLMKDGKANWSVIGHNAGRWAILLLVIAAILLGLYFLDGTIR
jgi:hypothetical protein